MKVQFRRDKRGEILMSDTFNWDYNPYRVGDKVIIDGIIWKKHIGQKDLVKIYDQKWNGDYEVVDIFHYIKMEQLISQNYTHECTIIQLKEI